MRDSPPFSCWRTVFLAELPRRLAIAIALSVFTQLTEGAAPVLETPRFIQAQNIGDGTARSVATTSGDGFVVVGAFSGTATFGPSNVTAGAGLDVFVARYGAQGDLLWLRTAGGNDPLPNPPWTKAHTANAVALDPSSNIFVAGYIESPANFGTTVVSGSADTGQSSLFLAKYDSSGTLLWVRSSETASQLGAFQVSESLTVDSSGNAYIAGRFTGNLKLGTTTLTAGADGNLFVAKYSPAGAVLWAKSFGTTFAERYCRIASDGSGGVLLAYQSSSQVLVVKRLQTSTGTDTLFSSISATGGIRPFGLAVGPNGDVFCAGDFAGLLSSGQQSTDPVSDAFLAKWNAAGALQWVRTGGGTNDDYAYSVVVDGVGDAYLCGVFWGTAQFSGKSVVSAGQRDSFIAKYGPAGDVLWTVSLGGSSFDDLTAAALTPAGDLLTVGRFDSTAMFGELTLPAGSPGIFASRLAPVPHLAMERQGSTAALVWHSATTNFLLESAQLNQTSLTWQPTAASVGRSGRTNSVSLPLDGGGTMLRLRRAAP